MNYWVAMLCGTVFEVLGDVLFKKEYPVVGVACYCVGTAFWFAALRGHELSKAVVVFTLINMIAAAVVGVFCFGENVTSKMLMGLALGVCSVLLVEA